MAYMTTNDMRLALQAVYPDSSRWKRRVENMRGIQVYAVYKKFEKEGRFEKSKKEDFHQMTLFELGMKDEQ